MPELPKQVLWRLDNLLLDPQGGTLCRVHPNGSATAVHIGSRAFQLLCVLVERRGELISQREILDAVWPGTRVEQNNLSVQVAALRRVLDANGGRGSSIQNIPGRGYRFASQVSPHPGHADHVSAPVQEPASDLVRREHRVAIWLRAWVGPLRSWSVLMTACLLGLGVLSAAVAWREGDVLPSAENTAVRLAPPSSPAEEGPRRRLSLVVLPFENLGGDGMTHAAVEAITDDLTTELARTPLLVVSARNAALAYKAKPTDVKRVGFALGLRYAVAGSVRRIDNALRINVRLVSAETNEHLWAGRFDAGRDEEVVPHISAALRVRLIDIESERSLRERPNDPDLTDLLIRAQHSLHNLPLHPGNRAEAVVLYERALSLDPSSVEAMAGLAEALLDSINAGPQDNPKAPSMLRRAEELVGRGELLRPEEKQLMFVRVYLLGMQRRCAELIPAAQRAINVHPSLTGTHLWLGRCMMFEGRPAEAVGHIERSIRINPNNPQIFIRYRLMAEALLFLAKYEDAILWLHKALASNPNPNPQIRGHIHASIAAAQSLAGRLDEARLSAAEAAKLWPALTVRGLYPFHIANAAHAAQAAQVLEGLRLAGIRDHAEEDIDYGLPPDDILHTDYEAPTPLSTPGAHTLGTSELVALLKQRRPLLLDTSSWGSSVPGALGLPGSGIGGTISDEYQERLRHKIQQLVGDDPKVPIVTIGWNAERFHGRNLALRLVSLGYKEVYWYRGGHEVWQAAHLPVAKLVMEEW